MPASRYFVATAGLTAILAGPGCTQFYNGALGFSQEDQAEVLAYQQERAEREHALNQLDAALGGKPAARIAFDGSTQTKPTSISPAELVQTDAPELNTPAGPAGPEVQRPESTPGPTHEARHAYVSTQALAASNPINPFGDFAAGSDRQSPMDSTGPVRRVSFTEEGADFDVTLDPTGQWLIYSSTRHREASDIYRQRVGGEAVTQLTDDPGNDVMPCISPDGRTIAFASDRGGNWDLYLMDADGGPAVQLTRDPSHDIHPSFSPDGSKLVYCSYGERSGQWQLVVIDVENPATKRYIGHGLFPTWSPTGDTILFQRARERGTRWFGVWTVELDAQGEAGSPTEIAWSPRHACITPAWSPDGSAVVFCTVRDPEADSQGGRPAESDVWLVNVDGSGRTRLTAGRFANLQPAWSADNTVYFVSNRGREGVENIWAIDSGDAMQMVRAAGGGQTPGTPATADAPTTSD